MQSLLLIPDSHNKKGHSPERFKWLGNLVADQKPEFIVNIGDWSDMPSLSSYDVGKKSYEGRRYKDDVEAGQEAIDLFEAPFKKLKNYKPRKVAHLGNHEERIMRAIENDPKLDGTIGYKDLGWKERGWHVPFYLEPDVINGVYFAHYFVGGVMGKPIGGENPGTSLINKMHKSCAAGHSHLFDYSERTGADGKKITGLVCGCFFAKGQKENYAGQAQKMWHNGVMLLHNIKDGAYDLETMSIDRLEQKYA